MYRKYCLWIVAVVFFSIQGCSGGNSSTTDAGSLNKGIVSVSLTDAPAYGLDHVWVTVRDLWFHTSDTAETEQAGWVKFPLSAPITLDLLELSNGAISAPVWDNIELPEGDYTQLRVFLARTENTLTDSASAENLAYNNQVDVTGDATAYPLRVPDAGRGISLTGEFSVKKNTKLKIAIDFDAGHDVVKIERNGNTEYILKPRLAHFDLDNAGAIIGSIDSAATGSNPSARFVFKAEQMAPNGQVHVVRRVTALSDQTGKFILFPLAPGIYDLVIRGINYETVIVKGIPVVKGTTPQNNPTVVPAITMTRAATPDYTLDATITSPTGAWVNFMQTLPGIGEVPYDIRFRHFNPLTGQILGFPLSSDPLQVGTYNASIITLSTVTPVEGTGGYQAVAGAPLYTIDLGSAPVSSSTGTLSLGMLNVTAPLAARSVSGSIMVPETFAPGTGFDRGILFAVHGGMIVNAMNVNAQIASGGSYTMTNLPGGTAQLPFPRACYAMEVVGWSSENPATRGVAVPRFVNLSTSDAAGIDLNLIMP
ncbi:MAG: hypothetical protein A2X58_01905 [Nitrospirae bacterium GWC2_56_14]|nr:MAG: hypothetical protein A2X58_01905 [Nitrospirae bacterium GWC2_56_14]